MLSYHNVLLSDAIGQSVALSVVKQSGQYMLMALRLPDGSVEKLDGRSFTAPMIVEGIQRVGAALVMGAIALFFLWVGAFLIFLPFAAIALWLVVPYVLAWRNASAARGDLDGRAALPVPPQ